MNSLDMIKNKIQKLYKNNPQIHVNASVTTPKVILNNEPVVLKGVYPHIFQIEEKSNGSPRTHTFQYTEVLLHHVEIIELENC